MKVSIFDVAKKSGLSVVTVSRVLNNSKTVRENNRLKVLAAIKELDYRPNAAARSLARGKTGIIGLITTTLDDAFLDSVVKEVNDVLADKGFFLALSIAPAADEEPNYLIQEDRVDGIILLSPVEEDPYVLELKKRGIPFVLIDNQNPAHASFSVVIDNYMGGYLAANHLIALGHRRIAHVGGQSFFMSTKERKRGFLDALTEAGLMPHSVQERHFGISYGYEVASSWIQSGNRPDAVFAGDDNIAIGIMNAYWNAGYSIPEHISIVGYDDQLIASQFTPAITTVRQPAQQVGRQAVDLLLKLMSGKPRRAGIAKLEPQLIVRETTRKA